MPFRTEASHPFSSNHTDAAEPYTLKVDGVIYEISAADYARLSADPAGMAIYTNGIRKAVADLKAKSAARSATATPSTEHTDAKSPREIMLERNAELSRKAAGQIRHSDKSPDRKVGR